MQCNSSLLLTFVSPFLFLFLFLGGGVNEGGQVGYRLYYIILLISCAPPPHRHTQHTRSPLPPSCRHSLSPSFFQASSRALLLFSILSDSSPNAHRSARELFINDITASGWFCRLDLCLTLKTLMWFIVSNVLESAPANSISITWSLLPDDLLLFLLLLPSR